MHDEAARCVSDVLEREAGHDSQGLVSIRLQNAHVGWFDDGERLDGIVKAARVRREIDTVVRLEVLQRAEKSIAMSGDADVSSLAWQCRSRDVTHRS